MIKSLALAVAFFIGLALAIGFRFFYGWHH
jgi:hypothetical protein